MPDTTHGRPVADSAEWTGPLYEIRIPADVPGGWQLFHLTTNEEHHESMIRRLYVKDQRHRAETLRSDPETSLDIPQLEAMELGRIVRDAAGDVWLKEDAQTWRFGEDRLSTEALVYVWSPLQALPGRYEL